MYLNNSQVSCDYYYHSDQSRDEEREYKAILDSTRVTLSLLSVNDILPKDSSNDLVPSSPEHLLSVPSTPSSPDPYSPATPLKTGVGQVVIDPSKTPINSSRFAQFVAKKTNIHDNNTIEIPSYANAIPSTPTDDPTTPAPVPKLAINSESDKIHTPKSSGGGKRRGSAALIHLDITSPDSTQSSPRSIQSSRVTLCTYDSPRPLHPASATKGGKVTSAPFKLVRTDSLSKEGIKRANRSGSMGLVKMLHQRNEPITPVPTTDTTSGQPHTATTSTPAIDSATARGAYTNTQLPPSSTLFNESPNTAPVTTKPTTTTSTTPAPVPTTFTSDKIATKELESTKIDSTNGTGATTAATTGAVVVEEGTGAGVAELPMKSPFKFWQDKDKEKKSGVHA